MFTGNQNNLYYKNSGVHFGRRIMSWSITVTVGKSLLPGSGETNVTQMEQE
jgi:hypothetical protein